MFWRPLYHLFFVLFLYQGVPCLGLLCVSLLLSSFPVNRYCVFGLVPVSLRRAGPVALADRRSVHVEVSEAEADEVSCGPLAVPCEGQLEGDQFASGRPSLLKRSWSVLCRVMVALCAASLMDARKGLWEGRRAAFPFFRCLGSGAPAGRLWRPFLARPGGPFFGACAWGRRFANLRPVGSDVRLLVITPTDRGSASCRVGVQGFAPGLGPALVAGPVLEVLAMALGVWIIGGAAARHVDGSARPPPLALSPGTSFDALFPSVADASQRPAWPGLF